MPCCFTIVFRSFYRVTIHRDLVLISAHPKRHLLDIIGGIPAGGTDPMKGENVQVQVHAGTKADTSAGLMDYDPVKASDKSSNAPCRP